VPNEPKNNQETYFCAPEVPNKPNWLIIKTWNFLKQTSHIVPALFTELRLRNMAHHKQGTWDPYYSEMDDEEDGKGVLPDWAPNYNDCFFIKSSRTHHWGNSTNGLENNQLGRLFSCLLSHLQHHEPLLYLVPHWWRIWIHTARALIKWFPRHTKLAWTHHLAAVSQGQYVSQPFSINREPIYVCPLKMGLQERTISCRPVLVGPRKPPIDVSNQNSQSWGKFIHFQSSFIHVYMFIGSVIQTFHTIFVPTLFLA
jgi:hypothetical protein